MSDLTQEQEAVIRMLKEYRVLYAQLHDHALSICHRLRIPRRPEWAGEQTPVIISRILGELETRLARLEGAARKACEAWICESEDEAQDAMSKLHAALDPGAVGENPHE